MKQAILELYDNRESASVFQRLATFIPKLKKYILPAF